MFQLLALVARFPSRRGGRPLLGAGPGLDAALVPMAPTGAHRTEGRQAGDCGPWLGLLLLAASALVDSPTPPLTHISLPVIYEVWDPITDQKRTTRPVSLGTGQAQAMHRDLPRSSWSSEHQSLCLGSSPLSSAGTTRCAIRFPTSLQMICPRLPANSSSTWAPICRSTQGRERGRGSEDGGRRAVGSGQKNRNAEREEGWLLEAAGRRDSRKPAMYCTGWAYPFGFGFIFPRQLLVGCGTKQRCNQPNQREPRLRAHTHNDSQRGWPGGSCPFDFLVRVRS